MLDGKMERVTLLTPGPPWSPGLGGPLIPMESPNPTGLAGGQSVSQRLTSDTGLLFLALLSGTLRAVLEIDRNAFLVLPDGDIQQLVSPSHLTCSTMSS